MLHSATALAFPSKRGQHIHIVPDPGSGLLKWISTENGDTWFTAEFSLPEIKLVNYSDASLGNRLLSLLHIIRRLSPDFLQKEDGLQLTTSLDFPRDWGLGTSSSLIQLMASWTGIYPYELLDASFGGSGYDIACADRFNPILYRRQNEEIQITEQNFHPPFLDKLYLGFSGVKQDSGLEVKKFLQKGAVDKGLIDRISEISKMVSKTQSLMEFSELLVMHEEIVGHLLGIPPVAARFKGFPGIIKSLGAWGGDFLLFSWEGSKEALERCLKGYGVGPVFRFQDVLYTA